MGIKTKLQTSLDDSKESYDNLVDFYNNNTSHIENINNALLQFNDALISAQCDDYGSIDISYSGDYSILKGVFRELRLLGYEPDNHVDEDKIASFSTYFRLKDEETHAQLSKVWFCYSSTVCKLTKVGVEMVERPIYEVECV